MDSPHHYSSHRDYNVNLGLPKAQFLAYKLSGCFNTAIFLQLRIFLIILVKQIYKVALKVPRKWPLKLGSNCNPDTVKCGQNFFSSKLTTTHAKIHFHRDSRYRTYEQIFTPSFNIFGHYMPFLSMFFTKLPFNGGVQSYTHRIFKEI